MNNNGEKSEKGSRVELKRVPWRKYNLLDEEKNRIREEKIFREDVRLEIEGARPEELRGKRLLSLLNSSFTLYFLSFIVVASLTAAVTTYQQINAEQSQKAAIGID